MHRDMEVIRQIILAAKDADGVSVSGIAGVSDEVFSFNAALLIEAGLAKGRVMEQGDPPMPTMVDIFRLTWAGCDFADSINDETIWKKAKENIIKPGASWTFALLGEYLKMLLSEKLGLG